MTGASELLFDMVFTDAWKSLRAEAQRKIRYLEVEALAPAEDDLHFYRKEGAARAAKELENFLFRIESDAKLWRSKRTVPGYVHSDIS